MWYSLLEYSMNNHIYSTLFKIQERKSDRRSREIAKKGITKHTHIKQGHVTLIYCINIKSPSSLNSLEKYIFKYLITICLKIGQPHRLRNINFTIYNQLPSSFNSLEKFKKIKHIYNFLKKYNLLHHHKMF